MNFDIYKLDGIDADIEESEGALEEYQDALLEFFTSSKEGQEHCKTYPDAGFWTAQLIHYGFHYIGVTPAQMKVNDIEELLVTDIFPRKISLSEEDEAEGAISELIAFWKFLQRQFNLPASSSIIKFLEQIQGEFEEMMFDPANFGMAKSLFMMGQSSGYDMTNKGDMEKFMFDYNSKVELQNDDDFPAISFGGPNHSDNQEPLQIVRKEGKIGRNTRCPCGSGKKYKRCCGESG